MRIIDADHLLETLSQGCYSSIRKVIEREPTVAIKQIPLDPIDQEVIGMYLLGRCPGCGHSVNADMDWCDQCGQKFVWRGQ